MENSKVSDRLVKLATFLFLLLVFIYGIMEALLYKDYDPKYIAVDVIAYAIGKAFVPITLAFIVSIILKCFKNNFKRVFLVYLMVFSIPYCLLTGYQNFQENKVNFSFNKEDINKLSRIEGVIKSEETRGFTHIRKKPSVRVENEIDRRNKVSLQQFNKKKKGICEVILGDGRCNNSKLVDRVWHDIHMNFEYRKHLPSQLKSGAADFSICRIINKNRCEDPYFFQAFKIKTFESSSLRKREPKIKAEYDKLWKNYGLRTPEEQKALEASYIRAEKMKRRNTLN